jgi:hypothetical protein
VVWQMPISENILKDSFIFKVNFFEKNIFLKFWQLFLELIYAKPTTWLWYCA